MRPEELTKTLRKLFVDCDNISEAAAARLIGMSQQNFNQKLKTGTLRYVEVAALLQELGYEIKWEPKKDHSTEK